ncbi:MAG: hypothetical protein RLZZ565_451, partial [Planctomycetota bacterium]
GVPYWAANIVVMEQCADHWLNSLAEISRSFLRNSVPARQFVITETFKRDNGTERTNYRAHKVTGTLTDLVKRFICPYQAAAEARADLTSAEKTKAFYEFLYTTLVAEPEILAGYDPEVKRWVNEGIADLFSQGELRRIDAALKQKAEDKAREEAAARARREAEEAARAKRAAAAAARKARRAKGGAA